jgi:hypothetical protein
MDSRNIHSKVTVFAQQPLPEANGDSVRALGPLALALDGGTVLPPDHAWCLIVEVSPILMPDSPGEFSKPLQHLVEGGLMGGGAALPPLREGFDCGKERSWARRAASV